jgi:metal-responsive CopG/Arc/MetJ family transcriptional regulator
MVKNGLSDIVLPDMSDNRLTIRVSPELRQKLERRARADRKDHSEIVREAPDQYLKPGDTAYDGFKKAGLIGVTKSGPRDLSTNKKHLEGFGRAQK